jgi:hypothetical protein
MNIDYIKNILVKCNFKFYITFIFLELLIIYIEYKVNTNYNIKYFSFEIILFLILLPSLYFIFISSHPKYLLLFYMYFSFYYLIINIINMEYKII